MMKVIAQVDELRAEIRRARQQFREAHAGKEAIVGFVPTMGYLHEGHESLIERARAQCDIVVLSIYVNPLQFGPSEDLATYPRDLERDTAVAQERGVDIVFAPTDAEMYPGGSDAEIPVPKIRVVVNELSDVLCGASRPGHFDGVATVVLKLLNIVQPDRAYFGMKDAQQLAVIKQMVADFNMAVEIIACETLREADGLAMSSRNVYLSEEERKQAIVLYEALNLAEQLIEERVDVTVAELVAAMHDHIHQALLAVIDYVSILSYPRLEAFDDNEQIAHIRRQNELIIALAVKFGKTRLIDNRILRKIE